MKYLFFILLICSIGVAQELTVEGGLNVTGGINSPTVDSLQQEITNLHAIIAALQSQINFLGSQLNLTDCLGIVNGTASYDCLGVCNGDAVEDACGTCNGSIVNENDCSCIDFDENEYATVLIGNQRWMAENLRVTHYRNGDSIQRLNIDGTGVVFDDIDGAYGLYNDEEVFRERYGLLYNAYIALNALSDNNRDVCPNNWHIPTDDEWKELELYIGMSQLEVNDINWRGDTGGKLKEVGFENWNSPNTGATDQYEFGARAAGQIHYNSAISELRNTLGYFWTSTLGESLHVYVRALSYNNNQIYRVDDNPHFGYSIRCIQD